MSLRAQPLLACKLLRLLIPNSCIFAILKDFCHSKVVAGYDGSKLGTKGFVAQSDDPTISHSHFSQILLEAVAYQLATYIASILSLHRYEITSSDKILQANGFAL